MRFFCGKLDDVTLTLSRGADSRVPFSSVAFQPHVPGESNRVQRLLGGGGCTVALWALGLLPYERSDTVPHPSQANEDEGAPPRWLHSEPSNKRIAASRIGIWPDHSPEYIIRVAWAPSGSHWMSVDARQVIVWARKDNPDGSENWVRWTTRVEPLVPEVFDACWIGNDRIAVGGTDRVIIRPVARGSLGDGPISIAMPDCSIMKGIAASEISNLTADEARRWFVALTTNSKQGFIYMVTAGETDAVLIAEEKELFEDGPLDTPLLRHVSIDPTSKACAFAFGERNSQTFAVLYSLVDTLEARAILSDLGYTDVTRTLINHKKAEVKDEKAEDENYMQDARQVDPREAETTRAHELYRDAKHRVRGHQSRVNVVAFGNTVRPLGVPLGGFLEGLKISDGDSSFRTVLMDTLLQEEEAIKSMREWPQAIWYAQASVEGCLSVWHLYLPHRPDVGIEGICVVVSPTSLVDQTGLVTDMAWSWDDRMLAVASDDGKLTLLLIEADDVLSNPLKYRDELYILANPPEEPKLPDPTLLKIPEIPITGEIDGGKPILEQAQMI